MPDRSPTKIGWAAAAGAIAAIAATPAGAALGGTYASVEADRVHLSARMTSTSTAGYAAHMLTAPNGGTVREFVRPDGTIFAVSWRGPARPDLRQLLGGRFEVFRTASAGHRGRTRMPIAVREGDMVVRSAGHPGLFWGEAYLPGAVPAGFSADDLR